MLILLSWTILRLAYIVWWSPWNLLGDEAYYWVESQHLTWSYAEKGPLLPWILRLFDMLFGTSEWAVRLPAALASSLAGWGVARVTLLITARDGRAALFAVILFILTPAFVANAQICTQDAFVIPWFVALAAIGLRIVRQHDAAESTWRSWIAFHVVLGLGLLMKQSMLLFLTSFVAYIAIRRGDRRWIDRRFLAQQLVGSAIIAVSCTPIFINEFQHGWPLLQHTLGHLGVGASEFASRKKGNPFIWSGNLLAGLIGAGGPVAVLAAWVSVQIWRHRRALSDSQFRDRLWLICTAWPSILFYVGISFTKPAVPSWPLPSLVTLLPLVAIHLADRWRAAGRAKLDALNGSILGYGLSAILLLSAPAVLKSLPFVGQTVDRKVLSRFTDQREKALQIGAIARQHLGVSMIVVPHYQQASLLSFYLPDGPTVGCAGLCLASHGSSFDAWPETSLASPDRLGGSMLLVGADEAAWTKALMFDRLERVDRADNAMLGVGFRGPRK